jgi:hypothetical protein
MEREEQRISQAGGFSWWREYIKIIKNSLEIIRKDTKD